MPGARTTSAGRGAPAPEPPRAKATDFELSEPFGGGTSASLAKLNAELMLANQGGVEAPAPRAEAAPIPVPAAVATPAATAAGGAAALFVSGERAMPTLYFVPAALLAAGLVVGAPPEASVSSMCSRAVSPALMRASSISRLRITVRTRATSGDSFRR